MPQTLAAERHQLTVLFCELAPVYNGFTEDFDTADRIDAEALLDALS